MVINGPAATAGSILNFFSINGVTVAILAEMRNVISNELPTTNPKEPFPCQTHPATNNNVPQMRPQATPIRISRKTTFQISLNSPRPVASPRMMSVEDCKPKFPPIAAITGINVTIAITS